MSCTTTFKDKSTSCNPETPEGRILTPLKGLKKDPFEMVMDQVFMIGITGGSASGKTTVCTMIMEMVGESEVVVISQDSYYKPLTEEQSEAAKRTEYNFDHPDSLDNDLLAEHLQIIKEGKSDVLDIPIYNFVTHSREEETEKKILKNRRIIVVEGIMLFWEEKLRKLFDLKVFVDTDDDIRLIRRILRDVECRGRKWREVLDQYQKFVKDSYEDFIFPMKKHCDVIIPWNRNGMNEVAIKLVVDCLKFKVKK